MTFLVAIHYKNGLVIREWFTYFEIKNDTWKWTLEDPKKKILKMGVEEIVAVVQEDYKA